MRRMLNHRCHYLSHFAARVCLTAKAGRRSGQVDPSRSMTAAGRPSWSGVVTHSGGPSRLLSLSNSRNLRCASSVSLACGGPTPAAAFFTNVEALGQRRHIPGESRSASIVILLSTASWGRRFPRLLPELRADRRRHRLDRVPGVTVSWRVGGDSIPQPSARSTAIPDAGLRHRRRRRVPETTRLSNTASAVCSSAINPGPR
jgi:hypothetical protein